MEREYGFGHLVLAVVVVLGLTSLMVCVETQAQIAFMSDRDGNFEIYVMDADGGNQRNLTNNPGDDTHPSWSPDGKRIVFCSDRDGHAHFIPGLFTSEIYVMDVDGGNQQNLTNDPKADRSPSWSPDGERIVFTSRRDGDDEIFLMDADGGNLQNLSNNRHDDYSPSWSPDGKRIIFGARRPGHFENDFGMTEEIYVMDTDGGNEQRLTENRNNDWDPSWSPDGKRIAFSFDRKGDFQNFDVYVMDADGANQQRLTNNRGDDSSPSWSPDGKRIAFSSSRDGNGEIYVMDADGRNPQNVTNNRHADFSPAWLNSPFSVAPAGKNFTMWGRLKQVDR